jgi:hypothetical protein
MPVLIRLSTRNASNSNMAGTSNSTAAGTSGNDGPRVGDCDAWTSPYCNTAQIRIERSAEGYQCMVDDCGQSG